MSKKMMTEGYQSWRCTAKGNTKRDFSIIFYVKNN